MTSKTQKRREQKARAKKSTKQATPQQQATAAERDFKQLQQTTKLFEKARELLKAQGAAHHEKIGKERDYKFNLQVLESGTQQDKISALSAMIQNEPQASIKYFITLFGLTKKTNKKWAEMAINALKDLFLEGYLLERKKDGRLVKKLYVFSRHPLVLEKGEAMSDAELCEVYFHHCVREVLRDLFSVIIGKEFMHADLEYFRTYAMDFVQDMIQIADGADLCEGAISSVVNKLGDSSKKVQVHAIQVLVNITIKQKSIIEELPMIIVRELGMFLEKRCSKPAHRVYALGCLNKLSTVVVAQNAAIRPTFIQIYFQQFHAFVHTEPVIVEVKKDRAVSKEKRQKLQKMAKKKAQVKKGDVCEEDNRVIELVLKGVNVLLVKSGMSSDPEQLTSVLTNDIDILFKLSHHNIFRIAVQTLKLLFQFVKASAHINQSAIETDGQPKNTLVDRFYRTLYESLHKPHKSAFEEEYFSLLFRAMKVDTEMGRVVAFAKRMLQMAFIGEANYTAATLLVLSEVIDSRTDLRLHLFGVSKMESDDSDEEHFEDVDRSEHSDKKEEEEKKVEKKVEPQEYDPLKIEPKFCAAATAPLWELVTLARHCHPTICLWAETILKGERIEYGGDPLLDFGLQNFLDRVAYKNPKSSDKIENFRKRMAAYEKPVNLIDFKAGDKPENERLEEEFMYKYMKMSDRKVKKQAERDSEDYEGEDSDPELEAYARAEIIKKMNTTGGDDVDSDEGFEYSDWEEGEAEMDEGKNVAEGGDFFEKESDLQEVSLEGDDQEEGEDEMDSGEMMAGGQDEYDDEEDEESDESKEGKKKDKKKKGGSASMFASYEEFAHMLDADDTENNKFDKMHQKRTFSKAMMPKNQAFQKRRKR